MPSRARPRTGLALAALAGLGCRTTPDTCKYDSTERCVWEAGLAQPKSNTDEPSVDGDEPVGEGGVAGERKRFDETLATMVEIIGAGLEWSLVDERARELCSDEPHAPELDADIPPPAPGAWTCTVPGVDLGALAFDLEASDGVLSLSAFDVDDAASAEVFAAARQRFDDWCGGGSLVEVESDELAEFYRCSLPEGPFLVLARFPRDLKAGRWQISIAIVDAG